eukprot:12100127-Alexandrium_andersonii.AAC.1
MAQSGPSPLSERRAPRDCEELPGDPGPGQGRQELLATRGATRCCARRRAGVRGCRRTTRSAVRGKEG